MIRVNSGWIKMNRFPNGEISIDFFPNSAKNSIDWFYDGDADLISLMMIKKHIDLIAKNSYNTLNIMYMPYSRMDRVESIGNVFTLRYVTEFINSLKFDKVVVYEPHSDVTPALLDNCIVESAVRMLMDRLSLDQSFFKDNDYLYFPDAGAQKRYGKMYNFPSLVGFKDRDFQTGRIKSLEVLGQIKPEHVGKARVAIVDDLCSKGGTFMLSAQKLKEMGANEIFLVVGHCENTIYDGEVLNSDLINKVYTTNSILTNESSSKIFCVHLF